MITLNEKNAHLALYQQIYLQIKKEIQEGRLKAGEKLFSKRKLAESLNVSVNTVEGAYSQLLSEGFIEARAKSGYYVCQIDAFAFSNKEIRKNDKGEETEDKCNIKIDFATDGIDSENFPYNTWRRLMKNCFNEYNPKVLKSAPPEGDWELREAIARHIYSSRGVNCSADSIIIGAGMDNLFIIISGILGPHFKITM